MKKPYWKNAQFWICPRHLPSARFPASVPACWFAGCTSVRPPLSDEIAAPPRPKRAIASAKTKVKSRAPQKPKMNIKPASPSVSATKATKASAPSDQPIRYCAWVKCSKGPDGGRNIARKRSKYCSRDCSNRNARANYNARSAKAKKK